MVSSPLPSYYNLLMTFRYHYHHFHHLHCQRHRQIHADLSPLTVHPRHSTAKNSVSVLQLI